MGHYDDKHCVLKPTVENRFVDYITITQRRDMNYKILGQVFDSNSTKSPPDLMYSSPEDEAFYKEATKGQPSHAGFSGTGFDSKGVQIPFSLGYHSIKSMRDLMQKSGFTSGNMLEIGFNLGYSASIWLTLLPEVKLTSVDISDKAETLEAARVVAERFPGRFKFVLSDSKTLKSKLQKDFFGIAFVDGDHSEAGIVADIENCLDLGIKTMIFDDFLPQFGQTIAALSHFPNLKLLEANGNLALGKF